MKKDFMLEACLKEIREFIVSKASQGNIEEITYKEKYEFLCSMLEVCDVGLYEKDAMLRMKESGYFQFYGETRPTVDSAIEWLMRDSGAFV